jgi:hypothetical protein
VSTAPSGFGEAARRLITPFGAGSGREDREDRIASMRASLLAQLILFDDVVLTVENEWALTRLRDVFGTRLMSELLEARVVVIRLPESEFRVIATHRENHFVLVAQSNTESDFKRLRGLPGWDRILLTLVSESALPSSGHTVALAEQSFLETAGRDATIFVDAMRLVLRDEALWSTGSSSAIYASASEARDLFVNVVSETTGLIEVETNVADLLWPRRGRHVVEMRKPVGVSENDWFSLDRRKRIVRQLIHRALRTVASLKLRLAEMYGLNAVTALRETDVALLTADLRGMLKLLGDPDRQERELHRVIQIAGFPTLTTVEPGRIDVPKFLNIVNSPEARAFRDWLSTASTQPDNDVRDALLSTSARLATLLGTSVGEIVRFAVSTGAATAASLIDPTLGISISAADEFVVRRLIPKPGPLAFISDLSASLTPDDR